MTPPLFMLSTPYQGGDLNGWIVQEKLDGCRACWDGRALWSRGGNPVKLHPTLKRELPPKQVLDGELINVERGLAGAADFMKTGRGWDACRFFVFDAPAYPGPYEERYAWLQRTPHEDRCLRIVSGTVAANTSWVLGLSQQMRRRGAEGLMAWNPAGLWVPGRTRDVLKLKEDPQ